MEVCCIGQKLQGSNEPQERCDKVKMNGMAGLQWVWGGSSI